MKFRHDLLGQVIRATFSLNLLRNIEKRRFPSILRAQINVAAFKIKLPVVLDHGCLYFWLRL